MIVIHRAEDPSPARVVVEESCRFIARQVFEPERMRCISDPAVVVERDEQDACRTSGPQRLFFGGNGRKSVGGYVCFAGQCRLYGDEPAVVVETVADFHLRKPLGGMADADFEGVTQRVVRAVAADLLLPVRLRRNGAPVETGCRSGMGQERIAVAKQCDGMVGVGNDLPAAVSVAGCDMAAPKQENRCRAGFQYVVHCFLCWNLYCKIRQGTPLQIVRIRLSIVFLMHSASSGGF